MERSVAKLFDDAAVFRRTAAGQRALVQPWQDLGTQAARLLSLVNGYTALRDLLDMGFGAADVRDDLKSLVEAGLMELVPPWSSSRY